MTVSGFALVLVLMAGQALTPGPPCAATALTPGERQFCHAEEASERALRLPPANVERRREFETAADHYRRSGDQATGELKVMALNALAATYGSERLHNPVQREIVLRELMALVPTDPRYAFELAELQEAEGFPDTAEDTLLFARQRHPQEVEAYRRLARFYARRIAALQGSSDQPSPEPVVPGERDADGVYRIGGQLPPPPRAGTPHYPSEAQDAGIEGAVQAEIMIDERGQVADARIVRSVPLLDDAALQAVRQWRFEPTLVEGQAVPVRMIVNVNFTLSR